LDKAVDEYASVYHDHPKDLQVKKNYIQLLIVKNRLDDATRLNGEILKASPSDGEALLYKAQILNRQGQPDQAANVLQTVIKNDPDNATAHYHLGAALDQMGNPVRAESEWRDAVRLRPDLVDAQRALANIAMRRGDMVQLADIATQIVNAQPTAPDGYLLRAISEMNRKDADAAETDIRTAISLAPQDSGGYIQLGNLRQLQKRFAESEKFYQDALTRDPASGEALSGLMNLYVSQKQVDKALAAGNAQVARVPNNSVFHDLLGTVLFDSKKDFKAAEAEFNTAIQLDKKNADAQLKLGQLMVAEGAPERAIATYQQALQDNSRDVRFYVLIGELCESRKDWTNAKLYYQKALEIQPENPIVSNNLAYVLLEEGGNIDLALSMAQTARRGMPDNPSTADTLGWAYYQKGVYGSAIDLFKDALKKSPANPTYHYHLGLAYQKSDQPGLAREHLQRVMKIKPDYPNADEVKKALADLQG